MIGETLRIRLGVSETECSYIGVPIDGLQGSLCSIDSVSSKKAGFHELTGACKAYHVTVMSGTHEGEQWWMPPSFFNTVCMFGERA